MPVTIRAALAVTMLAGAGRVAVAQCVPSVQRLVDDRQFDEAIAQTKSILVRAPSDDQAVHCLGVVSMSMDRPRDAVGSFARAVKLNDSSSLHHLWLGNALGSIADSTSKFKQPFLARRIKSEFERAVELDPRSIEARHGLIQFYVQAPGVMGGSVDKAKEQAREIGRINVVRGHFEMASILLDKNQLAEAEGEYLAAIKDAPDSAAGYHALGSFYQGQKRWGDAFTIYDKMIIQFPSDQMVHFQIGRTAALSGQQLERGEAALNAWLAAPPRTVATVTIAGAHHRLGMIFEKLGKKDQARAEYTNALAINPNSRPAKESLAALK